MRRAAIKQAIAIIVFLAFVAIAAYWQRETIVSKFKKESELAQPVQSGGDNAMPAVKVIVQPVEILSNDRDFEAVGTGRARLSVQIYPPVAEEVREVLFQAQQRVKKGDLLVQLDDREEHLAVRLAEVELQDARNLLDRYEKAVQQGGVPQSEVDSARAEYDAAQVALEQAKINLEKRQIIAPFDGIVGIPNVDPGDRVNLDTMITGLDDRAILQVDFEVPEALAGYLQSGGETVVSATTPAFPRQQFSGTITAQESRINPQRRTLLVRANIENPDDVLRPGMSFSTRWKIDGPDYPAVPEISLQWSREGAYVWIVRDGKAEKIPSRVIARTGGRILVEAAMTASDNVVVEGVQRLRPGAPVDVVGTRATPGVAADGTDFYVHVESKSGGPAAGNPGGGNQ